MRRIVLVKVEIFPKKNFTLTTHYRAPFTEGGVHILGVSNKRSPLECCWSPRIMTKEAGSFHIRTATTMKELGALTDLGIGEQPNLAHNLPIHVDKTSRGLSLAFQSSNKLKLLT